MEPFDNDNDLFKKAMGDIKPIKQTKREPKPAPPKRITRRKQEEEYQATPGLDDHYSFFDPQSYQQGIDADETISYYKQGLQEKQIRRLRQGKIRPEARLDLHHTRAGEVFELTDSFIQLSKTRNKRCLLIIHGKGFYSKDNTPLIKNMLNEWLRIHPDVVAFQSALPRDGGTGAIYVLIKQ